MSHVKCNNIITIYIGFQYREVQLFAIISVHTEKWTLKKYEAKQGPETILSLHT